MNSQLAVAGNNGGLTKKSDAANNRNFIKNTYPLKHLL